jgi:hypothetical protein
VWIETKLSDDPLVAVKMALAAHATGQLIIHVSQGTARVVVWREKKRPAKNPTIVLDKESELHESIAG